MNRGMPEEDSTQVADEILTKLDRDGDEQVNVYEFADEYVEILKKLRYRQLECEDKMLETYELYKHCKKVHETYSMEMNQQAQQDNFQPQCLLNIIEVRNIPKDFVKPYIRLTLLSGGPRQQQNEIIGQTESQTYENPVYNKRFQFNVNSEKDDRVLIEVLDEQTNVLGLKIGTQKKVETIITMQELREYMEDESFEIKELWFDFDQNKQGPKIRILFNFLYNKLIMYDQQTKEWKIQLQEDVTDYENIGLYLRQLQDIFEFFDFKNEREETVGLSFAEIYVEKQDANQFKKNNPRIYNFEKKILNDWVGKASDNFVKRLGYRKTQWIPCIRVLLLVQFILNVMSCYARPDFITQLVIVMTLFYTSEFSNINGKKFRLLPVAILLSMVYDYVWLFHIQQLDKEALAEGNMEL